MQKPISEKIGVSIAMSGTSFGQARLKHLADLESYRVRFYKYGLTIEKADSIVSYIVDRFGPGSMDVMKALDNIDKGLLSGIYTADNINTIYTESDSFLLSNAIDVAIVINYDKTAPRLHSLIIAAKRTELAMRLDKYLPSPVASFIANHWPKRWL